MTKLRAYRVALILSVALNVLLIGGIVFYLHFAWLFDLVDEAVGIAG